MTPERGGGMADAAPRVTTEAQRDRLHRGRRHGGVCSACGRPLAAGEPVYWEVHVVDIALPVEGRVARYVTTLEAPVGRECASPEFLHESAGQEAGRCAECGRGVYYRRARRSRHRVACSWICRDRAGTAARAAEQRDDQ